MKISSSEKKLKDLESQKEQPSSKPLLLKALRVLNGGPNAERLLHFAASFGKIVGFYRVPTDNN